MIDEPTLRDLINEEIDYHEFAPEKVDFIQQLDEAHLKCRALRHGWNTVGNLIALRSGMYAGATVRVLECARCQTARMDYLTGRGKVFYRKYVYAKDYLFPAQRAVGGLGPDIVLMELMRRSHTGSMDYGRLPESSREAVIEEIRKATTSL